MQERQHGAKQAVQQFVSQCVSVCENEPVSERESVSGSVFGPECWFVCVCETAAFAWPGAAEKVVHLPLHDYRGAGSWSGTDAQPHYWGPSLQEDGLPDVMQVDTVGAADSHQRVSKPALEEVVAGWELGWAALETGPLKAIFAVKVVELVVAALEKASVAAAGIAQQTEA